MYPEMHTGTFLMIFISRGMKSVIKNMDISILHKQIYTSTSVQINVNSPQKKKGLVKFQAHAFWLQFLRHQEQKFII